MNDWTSGYVAELDYTHDYFQEMSPVNMAFTATSQGLKHPLNHTGTESGLTYCELGCGQGFSANLLAAANPHIQFHAMDFNPAMIAGAAELAGEAGLDNVTFHERAFDDFGATPGLPEAFDVIALHGVYSWVSRENQRHIVNFLSRRLKPGGLVYISYNALPGWAAALPLRRILADRAGQGSGPLAPRIGEAVEFANVLQQTGAGYFAANPSAATRLAKLEDMPANYLAHEFFNKDWTPFHFADVAEDLAGAKLSFAGAASALDRVDDIALTPEQCALLNAEIDPVRREGLRDILVNAQFRSDLFARGRLPHTQRGAIGAWFETTLALIRPYHGGVLKLPESHTGEALTQAQYGPVLSALANGPATVRQLLDQGAFGEMVWAGITRMLTLLAGGGHLAPALPQEGLAARAERCRAFNLAVCKRAEESETYRFLASPVTGGGIAVDWFEQLFLLARSEGRETPQDWAALAWQILAPQGQRLQHDGRVLETAEENLAVLRARAQAFAARRLPLFQSLGLTLEAEAAAALPAGNRAEAAA